MTDQIVRVFHSDWEEDEELVHVLPDWPDEGFGAWGDLL